MYRASLIDVGAICLIHSLQSWWKSNPLASCIFNKKSHCYPVTFWKRSHSWARALHNTDCKVTLGSAHLTYKHGLQCIKPNIKLIHLLCAAQEPASLHPSGMIWSWTGSTEAAALSSAQKESSGPAHTSCRAGRDTRDREAWAEPSGMLNSEDLGFCLCKQIPFYFTICVAQSGIYGCWQA